MNNIQDILVTPNVPVNPYGKADSDTSARDDFLALMAGSMESVTQMGAQSGNAESDDSLQGITAPGSIDVNKELETKVSVNQNVNRNVKENIKPAGDNNPKVSESDAKKVEAETKEFVKGVKKLLTEELEISEEELTSAMETLGLSMMDLTEPKNLAMLLNEIKGEDAGINLLLDTSVKNIFDGMAELTGNLFSETGLDAKGIVDVLAMEGMEVTTEVIPMDIKVPVDVKVPVEASAEAVSVSNEVHAVTDKNDKIDTGVKADEDTNVSNDTGDKQAVTTGSLDTAVKENEEQETVNSGNETAVNAPVIKETESKDYRDVERTSEDEEADTAIVDVLRSKINNSNDNSGNQSSLTGQNKGQNEAATTTTASGPDLTPDPVNNLNGPQTPTFAESMQAVETPVEVPTYTNVNTQDVINQIVTSASTNITNDVKSMELMLNPQNLGRLLMQVSEQEGQITARFITQNEAVKTALEGAIANLVDRLNDQGIKVDAVEVSVGTHEFEENLEKNFAGDARENLQDNEAKEGQAAQGRSRGGIHLGDASYMEGAELTEAEKLEASLMRTYGNTVNFTA